MPDERRLKRHVVALAVALAQVAVSACDRSPDTTETRGTEAVRPADDIARLVSDLLSDDEERMERAELALTARGAESAPALIDVIANDDPPSPGFNRACRVLNAIDESVVVPALIAELRRRPERVRSTTLVMELGFRAATSRAACEELAMAVLSPNSANGDAAAFHFEWACQSERLADPVRAGLTELRPRMVELLRTCPSMPRRCAAVAAVARSGPADDATLELLLQSLDADEGWSLKRMCESLTWFCATATNAQLDVVAEYGHRDVRLAAIRAALQRSGPPDEAVIQCLVRRLRDSDDGVVLAAAFALGDLAGTDDEVAVRELETVVSASLGKSARAAAIALKDIRERGRRQ